MGPLTFRGAGRGRGSQSRAAIFFGQRLSGMVGNLILACQLEWQKSAFGDTLIGISIDKDKTCIPAKTNSYTNTHINTCTIPSPNTLRFYELQLSTELSLCLNQHKFNWMVSTCSYILWNCVMLFTFRRECLNRTTYPQTPAPRSSESVHLLSAGRRRRTLRRRAGRMGASLGWGSGVAAGREPFITRCQTSLGTAVSGDIAQTRCWARRAISAFWKRKAWRQMRSALRTRMRNLDIQ